MTELKNMKNAPRDGTEILVLYFEPMHKKWEIVEFDSVYWVNGAGIYFVEEDLVGWLPLPEIPN